jgi:hypothetical protein
MNDIIGSITWPLGKYLEHGLLAPNVSKASSIVIVGLTSIISTRLVEGSISSSRSFVEI